MLFFQSDFSAPSEGIVNCSTRRIAVVTLYLLRKGSVFKAQIDPCYNVGFTHPLEAYLLFHLMSGTFVLDGDHAPPLVCPVQSGD